jgi:hypothetical protein
MGMRRGLTGWRTGEIITGSEKKKSIRNSPVSLLG